MSQQQIDMNPHCLGPFTLETLPPIERGPHRLTEELVRAYMATMAFTPEMTEEERLKATERTIRDMNKSYNSRTVDLKQAIAEFHKVIGYKPTQAKNDVWLPCGRIVSHAEFITNLANLIKEYQPCSASLK